MSDTDSKVIILSDDNFTEVVEQNPLPVFVDYWATYCGPCKMISPIVEELAKDYDGKFVFGKLDIQKNFKSSTKHMVMALPTLHIFHNGKIVKKLTGVPTKKTMKDAIDAVLAG